MSDTNIEQLKYPIGKPQIPKEISTDTLKKWIETLRIFPNELSKLTKHLSAAQLDSPYRKDGWTIRQVIHHCADSHHNSYTRFKWTLTEDTPVIKTYFEDRWAALFDSRTAPIELSLKPPQNGTCKMGLPFKRTLERSTFKRVCTPRRKRKNKLTRKYWHLRMAFVNTTTHILTTY